MKATTSMRLRVGIFVVIALVIGTTVAFALGAQENIFKSKTTYFSVFDDVGGLQTGNTVRVAGVNVGSVTEVEITKEEGIRVYFSVIDEATHLIRGDTDDPSNRKGSQAGIGSKGLLGDRMIEVSVGAESLPVWNPDKALPNAAGSGLIQLAERTLKEVEGTAHNLQLATDPFADQQFSYDLKDTARNLAKVSGMLANSDGTIQALMTDGTLARDVKGAVRNLRTAANQVTELGERLNAISAEIQGGDGTAHALIYGTEGAEAIKNIRDATGSLASILEEVRGGDGAVHQLIYGNDEETKGTFRNLNKATADIAYLTQEMREGKGTIGALLTDPSVYEDIKRLIGDLERNDILRALVRYSIRRDQPARLPVVTEERGDAKRGRVTVTEESIEVQEADTAEETVDGFIEMDLQEE